MQRTDASIRAMTVGSIVDGIQFAVGPQDFYGVRLKVGESRRSVRELNEYGIFNNNSRDNNYSLLKLTMMTKTSISLNVCFFSVPNICFFN